jgi:hypothetical protein
MKTIQSILMLAVLLYAWDGAASPEITAADKQRPAFASLPEKYQTLLTTWLSQDCRVDAGEIEKDMAAAGPILEGPLWEAFELGPTDDDRADLQNSLGERYALRLRWLMQNGAEAVDSKLSTQLLAESEEQFRATEAEKLVNRWSDAAVAGLGLLCTEGSLGSLYLIAKDERNPSSIAAGAALERSANCRAR